MGLVAVLLEEGRQEGRQEEGSTLVQRLLNRRLGKLDAQRIERIRTLSLLQLESLAEALLDFSGAEDLDNWLMKH